MKLLIASDLHGSAYYTRLLLERFKEEKCERILLLGDILYHGPRNDLPRDYAPKEVIALLNPLSELIDCVRGNCDAEVDQMVLNFPIMADYKKLTVNGLNLYATHGHVYNGEKPMRMRRDSIMLLGHTHVPMIEKHESFTCLNPGSIAIPKGGSVSSYLILEERRFSFRKLEDNQEYQFYQA